MGMLLEITVFCAAFGSVVPHGYLKYPPQRSTLWRTNREAPVNYNDNELNCGGSQVQHSLGGKCGVCGDAYNGVRHNEAGGRYALGIIVGTYEEGETIEAEVKITANHLGYFEFRLCPHNDPSTPVTEDCMNRYLLQVGSGGETKFRIGSARKTYTVPVTLPAGVTCSQCVLQWRYRGGNNWGCEGGRCGLGYGPQENFFNCADIAITGVGGATQAPPTDVASTTSNSLSSQTSTTPTQTQTPTPTTEETETEAPPIVTEFDDCVGAGLWAGQKSIADWCKLNCPRGFCPAFICDCPGLSRLKCAGVGLWKYIPYIEGWCNTNCNHDPPYCPADYCICS